MRIRPATPGHAPAIWSIIGPVIRAGDTYALDRDMSEEEAIAYSRDAERRRARCEADGSQRGETSSVGQRVTVR